MPRADLTPQQVLGSRTDISRCPDSTVFRRLATGTQHEFLQRRRLK